MQRIPAISACGLLGLVALLGVACGSSASGPDSGYPPDAGDSGVMLGQPPDDAGAPVLTSVSSTTGPAAGGTQVTATGTGFTEGTTVTFGSTAATGVSVQSSTQLTAVAPPASSSGPVSITVTTSNGSSTLYGGYTYSSAVSTAVAFCQLLPPTTLSTTPGQQAGPVTGQIYIPGMTDQLSTANNAIEAEIGVGPTGSTPGSAPDSSWTWAVATWMSKTGPSNHNDEYQGELPAVASAGTYAYAIRFSTQYGGVTWTPCDSVGNSPAAPYNPSNAGVLTVGAGSSGKNATISYCTIHSPTTLAAAVGQPAGPVYGWVYAAGVTDQGTAPGAGVSGWLGTGPLSSLPDGGWTWIKASWDAKQGPSGHNDEYEASLPAQTDAGTFAYAFRFELDAGAFAYCDTEGDPVYETAQQGVLTVSSP